jgi:hypothetical protein
MFSAQTNNGIHTLKGCKHFAWLLIRLSRPARTGLAELFSRGLDTELRKGAAGFCVSVNDAVKTIPAPW